MIQEVTVVGDGGAFDYDKTNSSFLIHTDKCNILYDCGGNVFDKLREMGDDTIRNIRMIIISHDDDDHIGSIRTLLFYMYFVLGRRNIDLYCPEDTIKRFNKVNMEMKSSELVQTNIVKPKRISNLSGVVESTYGASFEAVRGIHHVRAYGIVVSDGNKNIVAISGDTKANYRFEESIRTKLRNLETTMDKCLIFHDYSFWDAPSRQVHACDSDVDVEYSALFISQAIMYHNDKANIAGRTFEMPIKFEDIVDERRLSNRKKF